MLLSLMTLCFLSLSLLIVLNPSIRKKVYSLQTDSQRTVLAQIESSLSMPNKNFKIIKVQHKNSLWVEIYDLTLSEDRVATFKIASKYDGQMFVNERASNLFVADLDGDQILEIIAPSFNKHLKPKIHAIRYNPITDGFSKITNTELINSLNM